MKKKCSKKRVENGNQNKKMQRKYKSLEKIRRNKMVRTSSNL